VSSAGELSSQQKKHFVKSPSQQTPVATSGAEAHRHHCPLCPLGPPGQCVSGTHYLVWRLHRTSRWLHTGDGRQRAVLLGGDSSCLYGQDYRKALSNACTVLGGLCFHTLGSVLGSWGRERGSLTGPSRSSLCLPILPPTPEPGLHSCSISLQQDPEGAVQGGGGHGQLRGDAGTG
jgi:hypothetical protein